MVVTIDLTGTTQLNCSLLIVSVIAILLPVAFHQIVGGDVPISEEAPAILSFSRGVRVYCHPTLVLRNRIDTRLTSVRFPS